MSSIVLRAAWVLPIDAPCLRDGWVEIADGRILARGTGRPPARAADLGHVALLPGLVNAHTHLELSWLAGRVPPAGSMVDWIRQVVALRTAGPDAQDEASIAPMRAAVADVQATGTVLVGDISNTLASRGVLAEAGLAGVVFYELLGFNVVDAPQVVRDAWQRLDDDDAMRHDSGRVPPGQVVAHAPYSVSPALFREIARRSRGGPLSVHIAESAEEIEFLRSGTGAFRELLESIGVFTHMWSVPGCQPLDYLVDVGYLQPGLLAVHGVHLDDDALARLRDAGGYLVTCPRSNAWVGAGLPRLAHAYTQRVPVAIGTDSLASASSLNLFDEMAEIRRIAPDVSAACILESATRVGAEALGFGAEYGTIEPGKTAALIAVEIPRGTTDVEEFLVSGVPRSAVKPLEAAALEAR
jgi:cytosine/adenosine deaminase-related metal-dependent hydrolase